MPISQKKNILFTLIMIVFTIVLGLILAETVIRVYNATRHYKRAIWIPDRWLGYRHTANNKFIYTIDEPEGKVSASQRTNSMGIPGPEISTPKPASVVRILVLGDSFTEAFSISQDRNFCKLLESRLNQNMSQKGKTYEVINAGVSGFSPISEYYYFKRELKKLDPDYVILQLYANDVHNDNEATEMSVLDDNGLPYRINRYFYKNMYQLKARDYHPVPDNSFVIKLHDWLVEQSRFYEYLYLRSVKSNKSALFNKQFDKDPQFHHDNYFFIVQGNNALFKDEAFRTKALSLTWRYILALKNETEAQGAKFRMFYIPLHEQILPKDSDIEQKFYFSQPANTYFNQALAEFSRDNGVVFHDMFVDFKEYPRERHYFKNDCHLTEKGHEAVARSLYDSFFKP